MRHVWLTRYGDGDLRALKEGGRRPHSRTTKVTDDGGFAGQCAKASSSLGTEEASCTARALQAGAAIQRLPPAFVPVARRCPPPLRRFTHNAPGSTFCRVGRVLRWLRNGSEAIAVVELG